MSDRPIDVLHEIADRLGDLPARLAAVLAHHGTDSFRAAVRGVPGRNLRQGGEGMPRVPRPRSPDRAGAVQRLLGAAGGLGVPGASGLASMMARVRNMMDAWKDFQAAFSSRPKVERSPLPRRAKGSARTMAGTSWAASTPPPPRVRSTPLWRLPTPPAWKPQAPTVLRPIRLARPAARAAKTPLPGPAAPRPAKPPVLPLHQPAAPRAAARPSLPTPAWRAAKVPALPPRPPLRQRPSVARTAPAPSRSRSAAAATVAMFGSGSQPGTGPSREYLDVLEELHESIKELTAALGKEKTVHPAAAGRQPAPKTSSADARASRSGSGDSEESSLAWFGRMLGNVLKVAEMMG